MKLVNQDVINLRNNDCCKADKSVDEMDDGEVSSVTARGIVDMLERDNKSLVQRSRELEKQLHVLRATGSRMPPSKLLQRRAE